MHLVKTPAFPTKFKVPSVWASVFNVRVTLETPSAKRVSLCEAGHTPVCEMFLLTEAVK